MVMRGVLLLSVSEPPETPNPFLYHFGFGSKASKGRMTKQGKLREGNHSADIAGNGSAR